MDQIAVDRLATLVEQTEAGDASAEEELRQLLDNQPELWPQHGDLDFRVRTQLIDVIAGDSPLIRASLHQQAKKMAEDLSVPGSTALHRLSVTRVVTSWIDLRLAELLSSQAYSDSLRPPSLIHARFLDKRLQNAHRRHQDAVRMLALVSRISRRIGKKKDVVSPAIPPTPTVDLPTTSTDATSPVSP